jgi:hypothetical protein
LVETSYVTTRIPFIGSKSVDYEWTHVDFILLRFFLGTASFALQCFEGVVGDRRASHGGYDSHYHKSGLTGLELRMAYLPLITIKSFLKTVTATNEGPVPLTSCNRKRT